MHGVTVRVITISGNEYSLHLNFVNTTLVVKFWIVAIKNTLSSKSDGLNIIGFISTRLQIPFKAPCIFMKPVKAFIHFMNTVFCQK